MLRFFKSPNKTIEHEAALSLFVAQHTTIAQIDHPSSLCTSQFGEEFGVQMQARLSCIEPSVLASSKMF